MSYTDLNQNALKGYQFAAALHDLYETWATKWNEAQSAAEQGFDAAEIWAVVDPLAVLLNNAFGLLAPIASNSASKAFLERTMKLAFENGHLAASFQKAWDPQGVVVPHPEAMFETTSAMATSLSGFDPVLALGKVLKTSSAVSFKEITPDNVDTMWSSRDGGGALPGMATVLKTVADYSDDFYRWSSSTGDLKAAAAMTSLGSQLSPAAMVWVQVVDSALNGAPLPLKFPATLKSVVAAGVFLQPRKPKVVTTLTRNPFRTEPTPPIINKIPTKTGPTFHSGATNTGSGGNNGKTQTPGTEVTPVIPDLPDEPCIGCNDFPVVNPAERKQSLTPLLVIGGAVVLGAVIAWRS